MLIFLGVFFLFTVIKDVLSSSESASAISRIQESTSKLVMVKDQVFPPFANQKEAFKTIEEGLVEGIGEESLASKIAEGIKSKLSGFWENINLLGNFQNFDQSSQLVRSKLID